MTSTPILLLLSYPSNSLSFFIYILTSSLVYFLSPNFVSSRGRKTDREMGNCQAIDAAALVIQHPCGKIERLYWPVSASEVMRLNPGHYVSLIIPLPVSDQDKENHDQHPHHQNEQIKTVRFTRVKLLRPNETLALGHAYRLVTTQGKMKYDKRIIAIHYLFLVC